MANAFLFGLNVALIGFCIAGATSALAALIGAPQPCVRPVAGADNGRFLAVSLWLLAGPVSLLRSDGYDVFGRDRAFLLRGLSAFIAVIWAFCLGLVVLELVFRLFIA